MVISFSFEALPSIDLGTSAEAFVNASNQEVVCRGWLYGSQGIRMFIARGGESNSRANWDFKMGRNGRNNGREMKWL